MKVSDYYPAGVNINTPDAPWNDAGTKTVYAVFDYGYGATVGEFDSFEEAADFRTQYIADEISEHGEDNINPEDITIEENGVVLEEDEPELERL